MVGPLFDPLLPSLKRIPLCTTQSGEPPVQVPIPTLHGSPEIGWLVGVAAAGTTVAGALGVDVAGTGVDDICAVGGVETDVAWALFGLLCEGLINRTIVVEAKMITNMRATEATIGHR